MSNNSLGARPLTPIGHVQSRIRLDSTRQRNVQEDRGSGMAEELAGSKSWKVVTTVLMDSFRPTSGPDPREWRVKV